MGYSAETVHGKVERLVLCSISYEPSYGITHHRTTFGKECECLDLVGDFSSLLKAAYIIRKRTPIGRMVAKRPAENIYSESMRLPKLRKWRLDSATWIARNRMYGTHRTVLQVKNTLTSVASASTTGIDHSWYSVVISAM